MSEQLNKEKLANIFEREEEPTEVIVHNPCPLPVVTTEEEDPDTIIRNNIDTANSILDVVQKEIVDNNNTTSRLIEVAAKLIDSVTNAASQIQNTTLNKEHMEIRRRLAEIKQIETNAKVKEITEGRGSREVIIATREDILDVIKGKKVPKQLKEGEKSEVLDDDKRDSS